MAKILRVWISHSIHEWGNINWLETLYVGFPKKSCDKKADINPDDNSVENFKTLSSVFWRMLKLSSVYFVSTLSIRAYLNGKLFVNVFAYFSFISQRKWRQQPIEPEKKPNIFKNIFFFRLVVKIRHKGFGQHLSQESINIHPWKK